MKYSIHSVAELRALASQFLNAEKRGTAIGLSGELGAGKTEFVRQILSLLGDSLGLGSVKVISPTFVIHQSYPALKVEHFDLYRLENVTREGLVDIGYYDALENVQESGGFLFVEWPEKVRCVEDLGLEKRILFSLEGEIRWVEMGSCS